MNKEKKASLDFFILKIGGEIREKTNEYEIARFVLKGKTGVIYEGKRGISFSNNLAKLVYNKFLDNDEAFIGNKKKRTTYKTIKEILLKRDGNRCFYTFKELNKDDMSVEHLIPLGRGGSNNIDNMVLCDKSINMKLANNMLLDKLKVREQNIIKGITLIDFIKVKYLEKRRKNNV